jgi:protease IV
MSRRTVSAVLSVALLAGGGAALDGCRPRPGKGHGPSAAASGSASATAPAEDDPTAAAIAEIDLTHGAPETRAGGLFRKNQGSFYDLMASLTRFAADEDKKGLFIRFGTTRVGWGRAAEAARSLSKLREQGKIIYCHADDLGNATYYLAAQACDRVFISPAGSVTTVGLALELVFAKDLLAKVGVEADILQIGKFKGTGETYTRSEASEEMKKSIGGVLADLRDRWLEGVEVGRHDHTARRGLEEGPHTPQEAKALGLIDEVAYAEEAKTALRARVSGGRTEALFGKGSAPGGSGGGLVDLVRVITGAKRGGKGGPAHISVLRASGAITMERAGGIFGEQSGIDAKTLTHELKKLREDEATKAVVLRIDSPGGSALASDLLWYELMQLRKKKPLIVSVGDMAASGGYYLACTANKIVAEETSIVGSIGVVGGKLVFGPALRKLGVNVETLPANPASSRATYESPMVPWDPSTRDRVLATMTSIYDLFLSRVAEGRGMPREKVETFAEGRIFSGREARSLGMVDAWGGISEAIELARAEAKLDESASVRLVGEPSGLFDALGLGDDDDDVETRGLLPSRPGVLTAVPGAEAALVHAESMLPLALGERALVAVPFGFLVR